ncbi:MAG: hypothetical protein KJ792_12240 [Actinobacteria bacterium]|nr:hypothetical protein [Actinomycetota bacterium]MCG2803589.1 DUF6507 family protein [Cellulomonas sp.]
MTGWRIEPTDVQGVLSGVEDSAQGLATSMTEAKLTAAVEALTWGGGITQAVPGAVQALFEDQAVTLSNIGNRINAGLVGVANATIAYRDGQEEMAATFQDEALRSAGSGDFSFFADHGTLG